MVTMGNKKRKCPFLDMFQWFGKEFSSKLEECVAPPSSKRDVGDSKPYSKYYLVHKIVAYIL
jgi:hypothetical protein